MNAAAVVNPRAGGGAGRARWIAARIPVAEVRWTARSGHAAELARELACAGYDPIFAAGGDGTLGEVVDGVIASGAGVSVGIVPTGRGVDFFRHLERRPHAGLVDALLVRQGARERHAVNVASVGLGGRVARRPKLPYLAAAAWELLRGARFDLRISLDGGPVFHAAATTLAIANGSCQGGGMRIAPLAEIDDGLIDVTLIEPVGPHRFAFNLPKLYSGAILDHPKVRHWRARSVRVEAAGDAPVEIDGDPAGDVPLEIHIRPRAWRLVR